MRKLLMARVLVLALGAFAAWMAHAQSSERAIVSQARELIDTYYGSRDNLSKATALLAKAYAEDPKDANVFVQAARVTVLGGHIVFHEFQQGTVERYGALLDRAIVLDPSNSKAHILKAEVFKLQGRLPEQLEELRKAEQTDTKDPWLWMGYANYYSQMKEAAQTYGMFERVEQLGPGKTASERKAYVNALLRLSNFEIGDEGPVVRLKRYAPIALKERYPTDAWTPMNFAGSFIDHGQFEDAVFYAREALKTMDFGAGRSTLAVALCGQIAQARRGGRALKEMNALVKEARSLGVSRDHVIAELNREGRLGAFSWVEPYVAEILPR